MQKKTLLLQEIVGSRNMRVKYCCETKAYKNYYLSQVGHGMPYFAGARVQQGYGLGNLFSSIAKSVLPLVKKSAKSLGKQVLQSGVEFTSDVLHGKNAKQAAIDQARAAGSNLLQVAQQKIGKRKPAPRKVQKKKHKRHHDIFSLTMPTLVHPSSAESTTSQLDLFSVPPSQTSLEEGSFIKYHPVSVLASTDLIKFTISAENSNYIDLDNSFLYVRASVTTAAGADLAKNLEIAPDSNFLHTLWTQVDVYLNGSLVTQSNNNYPYRAYIENLLSFGQEAKKSQLSALLLHRNTSEHFDTREATNLGYTKQKSLAAESKEIDMRGKLHLDLFFQNRYLLNGVEVRLRLIRSNDLFCLHGNANQADNKVSLKEVTLFVRKVKPNPAIQLAHVKALQHGTAKYPLRRVEVKSFTVPTGN